MTAAVVSLVFVGVVLVFSVATLLTVRRRDKREEDARQFQRELEQHRMFTMIDALDRAGRLHEVTKDNRLEDVYLDYLRKEAPVFDTTRMIPGPEPGTLYIPRKKPENTN